MRRRRKRGKIDKALSASADITGAAAKVVDDWAFWLFISELVDALTDS